MKRISFLGLGIMGAAMARRLLEHGVELTVWNRNPERARTLVDHGARLAATPADAARGAEAVIAMIADDHASRSVWTGEGGALPAMGQGALAIESSTLTVEWVRELGAAASKRRIGFLDAPVTGSKRQAEDGALNFLVGGDASVVDSAKVLFATMGRGHVHVGPAGSGALLKLINNFMCGVQVASLAEAIAMAERAGLDVQQAGEVLAAGSPGSPLVKMVVQRMVARDYTPNFLMPLMVKDLTYAIDLFAAAGIELDDARAARERFAGAVKAGYQNEDIAAVVEPMRRGSSEKPGCAPAPSSGPR
jgi:3-hydroxyisobutyrate dehydrogenase